MKPENKALIERELGPFIRDARVPLPPAGMVHIAEVALDRLLTAAREEGRAISPANAPEAGWANTGEERFPLLEDVISGLGAPRPPIPDLRGEFIRRGSPPDDLAKAFIAAAREPGGDLFDDIWTDGAGDVHGSNSESNRGINVSAGIRAILALLPERRISGHQTDLIVTPTPACEACNDTRIRPTADGIGMHCENCSPLSPEHRP